jgi:hypothetical protein
MPIIGLPDGNIPRRPATLNNTIRRDATDAIDSLGYDDLWHGNQVSNIAVSGGVHIDHQGIYQRIGVTHHNIQIQTVISGHNCSIAHVDVPEGMINETVQAQRDYLIQMVRQFINASLNDGMKYFMSGNFP